MVEIAKALGREPQASDPRRGDLGAHRRRRRDASTTCSRELKGAGLRDPLHLAPHARDRGAGRHAARCSATAATSRPSPRAPARPRRDRRS